MRVLLAAAILALMSFTGHAAENLDRAVESLARQIVNSRPADAAPLRVAVTAFVASDRRTTQFTNFLMSALTGEMVAMSNGKFRVIERQQLEAALAEIEMQNVPVFSAESAQNLGNFLGVDALIIGDITPLADTVRLDARLIMVETVETIAQARDWVPLTPIVANQLSATVRSSRIQIGEAGPDLRAGIWKGEGVCGDTRFGVALSLIVNPDDSVVAMQTFYPSRPGQVGESGVFEMEGEIDAATGILSLTPRDWIYQPANSAPMAIEGVLDTDTASFEGKYLVEGCQGLSLRRSGG